MEGLEVQYKPKPHDAEPDAISNVVFGYVCDLGVSLCVSCVSEFC